MSARPAITVLILLASQWVTAQNVVQEPQEDPVQTAIREFNERDGHKPVEVTVVLPPPDDSPSIPAKEDPESDAGQVAGETPSGTPVLVTGKAPEDSELVANSEETDSPEELAAEPEPEPESDPHKGLEVRVEKIQSGMGSFDPSQVKLLAPFPAKPLAEPPAGWRLEASAEAPPFTREVELSPGKHITLTIRPHLLVPVSDGVDVFSVSEPGFDPSLGYCQNTTAGAVIAQSIRQLDDDSKQLGAVIDNLQQLLVSLPKPEPAPESDPKPTPGASTKRKR